VIVHAFDSLRSDATKPDGKAAIVRCHGSVDDFGASSFTFLGLRVLLGFLVSGSRQFASYAAEIVLALTVESGTASVMPSPKPYMTEIDVEDHVLHEYCSDVWFSAFCGIYGAAVAQAKTPALDTTNIEKLSVVLQKLSKLR
jgi:hypothetical protein